MRTSTIKNIHFSPHKKDNIWKKFYPYSSVCSLTLKSQKTQGFCVADFATLSDEIRSRSKIFPLFICIKEPCLRKFEGLERSKRLGISQTNPGSLTY